MKLLIIDDDFLFGNLLMHQITETSEGALKVSFLSQTENLDDYLGHADLILLDKNLDECSLTSYDVLNVLEQNGEKGKVIIMSGSEDSEIENYPFLLKNEFLAEKLVANYC